MIPPNPLLEAVLTRHSAAHLTEPAPDRTELEHLVQAAATAPDHGRLRPWRLLPITGSERGHLGDVLGQAAPPERAARAAAKPLRAPLLLTIVHCPLPDHPKVPAWEQLAATTAMVTTLSLLLHGRGWASIWRTGSAVEDPLVRKHLGLGDTEQLLGWLYIGTRPPGDTLRPRPPLDLDTKISWSHAGS
ncbi:nitroreductase (plasmid) [Streptomyces sp. NBC_01281]|uniref:nitroreductase family protein n=1 Tax=Streptomyces sp. NBC_01281 TaxID=2903811 RepID=UPI002E0E2DF4|nr:nitroreductase [Streptomyces sp. NBC_01281]